MIQLLLREQFPGPLLVSKATDVLHDKRLLKYNATILLNFPWILFHTCYSAFLPESLQRAYNIVSFTLLAYMLWLLCEVQINSFWFFFILILFDLWPKHILYLYSFFPAMCGIVLVLHKCDLSTVIVKKHLILEGSIAFIILRRLLCSTNAEWVYLFANEITLVHTTSLKWLWFLLL